MAGDIPPQTDRVPAAPFNRVSAVTPNLRKLMAVAFASTMGYFTFASFLSPYLRSAGVSVVWVGLFFSLDAALEAPVAFAGGLLADRVGRRPVMVAGRLLRTAGWAVAVLAPSPAGLVAGACLLGLGGMAASGYRALIAESAAPGQRASAFAYVGVVENLTGVVVPPIAGVIAARAGLGPVLVGVAVLSAALVLVFSARLKETRAFAPAAPELPARATRPERPKPDHPSLGESLRFVASRDGRGAALMGLIWLVTGFSLGLLPPIFGLYVTDRFGVGYAGLGAVSTAMALGSALGQFVGGRVADRLGHSRLMILSLCVTAPSWLLITVAGTPWLFSLFNLLTYLVAYVSASCWEAVGANAVTDRLRGSVLGLFGGLQAAGVMIGSAAAGLAYARNMLLPWYLLAACDLTMLLLVIAGRRAAWRGFAVGQGSGAGTAASAQEAAGADPN